MVYCSSLCYVMVALWYNVVHYGALWYNVVEAYADTGHHSSPATPQHLLIASLTTTTPIWLFKNLSQNTQDVRCKDVRMFVLETMQNSAIQHPFAE